MNRTLLPVAAVVAWACLLHASPGAAQPGPPTISKVTINNGSPSTFNDEVTVEVQYTHPAAPSVPIPFYRVRVTRPGEVAQPWAYKANTGGRNAFTALLMPRGQTPLFGPHVIDVQLRDGAGRESAIAQGTVLRLLAGRPPTVASVEYRVAATDIPALVGFARLNGYLNTAEPMNPTSTCSSWQNGGHWHLRMQKLVVPVPGVNEVSPTPRCRFGFFKGKALQYDWRLKSAAFDSWASEPATWVVEHAIAPTGRDAWFSIVGVATGAMGNGEIKVREFVFEGPPGLEWRKAFKQ